MKKILLLFLLCFVNFVSAKSYFGWSDELLEKLQNNDKSAQWYVWGVVDTLVHEHDNLCVPEGINPNDILDIVSAYLVKLKIEDPQMFPAKPAPHSIFMAMFGTYKCKN